MIPFWKKFREAGRPRCAMVVVAAGSARRMGGVNKVLQPLDGVPVLVRTLTSCQLAKQVDEILVAVREEDLVEVSQLCRTYEISKCSKVVRGGESRVHSALLAALEASPETALIGVHDGARPLVTPEAIDRAVSAAVKCGAAALAIPLKDTVKAVQEDGAAVRTLERERLRAVQTPQVFEASLLKAALQSALENNAPVTDDASAVEALGKTVYLVEGEEENLKITTPLDLVLAEAVLAHRKGLS